MSHFLPVGWVAREKPLSNYLSHSSTFQSRWKVYVAPLSRMVSVQMGCMLHQNSCKVYGTYSKLKSMFCSLLSPTLHPSFLSFLPFRARLAWIPCISPAPKVSLTCSHLTLIYLRNDKALNSTCRDKKIKVQVSRIKNTRCWWVSFTK